MDKTLQTEQIDRLAAILEAGAWVSGETPSWFLCEGRAAIAVPVVYSPHPYIKVWRNVND